MTDHERWFAMALRAYPRAYRDDRGAEMLATLAESSVAASRLSVAADCLDLVRHGLRMRLALGPDRYPGRVLMLAALPAFAVAAVFCGVLFVACEILSPQFPHFGPFQTVGAAVELLWMVCALGAFALPRLQRNLAALCIVATVAAIPVGDAYFSRPCLSVFVIMIGLGLPGLLAPVPDTRSRHATIAAGCVGVVALGLLVALAIAARHYSAANNFPEISYYRTGMLRLNAYLPSVAIGVWMLGGVLVALRRVDWLSAGALVLAPFFAAGVTASGTLSWASLNALALGIVIVGLGAAWVWDLRSVKPTVRSAVG